MLIVAIAFVLETYVGLVEARCVTNRPALMKPPAIGCDSQGRGEQARKRPVNAIFSSVATLSRKSTVGVVRQDCLVGHCRIIKGQRAIKVAIARYAPCP